MSLPKVTRCICSNISFAEVKKIADEEGIKSIQILREKDICCNTCLMCESYVEMVLATGRTEFELGVYVSKSKI